MSPEDRQALWLYCRRHPVVRAHSARFFALQKSSASIEPENAQISGETGEAAAEFRGNGDHVVMQLRKIRESLRRDEERASKSSESSPSASMDSLDSENAPGKSLLSSDQRQFVQDGTLNGLLRAIGAID